MKILALTFLLATLAACATKPVPCDQHLVPINPPAKVAPAVPSTGARP